MLFNVNLAEQSVVQFKLYKRSVLNNINVKQNCSRHHKSSVQLQLSVGTTRTQLTSSVVIAGQDITKSKWITFNGLNTFIQRMQHSQSIKIRIVGKNVCDGQIIDLHEVGILDNKEVTALLVVYSSNENIMRPANFILTADRKRREVAGSTGANLPSPSLRKTIPCRLVKYNVRNSAIIPVS